MNINDKMRQLAERIRKENKGLTTIAPEPVNRDKTIDIATLNIDFSKTDALMENGEIIRNV